MLCFPQPFLTTYIENAGTSYLVLHSDLSGLDEKSLKVASELGGCGEEQEGLGAILVGASPPIGQHWH